MQIRGSDNLYNHSSSSSNNPDHPWFRQSFSCLIFFIIFYHFHHSHQWFRQALRGSIMWNKVLFGIALFSLLGTSWVTAETVKTYWGGGAEMVYDAGFMQTLMKHPSGGVSLFNRTLIENDSPGVGVSEKGPNLDAVWGKNRGRKIFFLEDPRAFSAWIVIMPAYGKPLKHPLKFFINGHETAYDHPETRQTVDYYRWLEFPAKWLQKGKNTLQVRAVNKLGAKGKPSVFVVNHADAPFGE